MKQNLLQAITAMAMFFALNPIANAITIPPLTDELSGQPIGEGTRNLIICIHGWNNPPVADVYSDTTDWSGLVANLEPVLNAAGSSDHWSLLLYHWETDANTGGIIDWSNPNLFDSYLHGTEAAFNAATHGISLGPRLPLSLRRVQFITHSAGAWCAYNAAYSLMQLNPYVVVQITLLDPYIPNEVTGFQGGFPDYSDATINSITTWSSSSRFNLLENYYANEVLLLDTTKQGFPTLGTQETFVWGGIGINQRIDWANASPHYAWHSGPVKFYGDTIKAANLAFGESLPSDLPPSSPPYVYQGFGWYNSMFHRTRPQWASLPRIVTQPQNKSVASGATVTLSVQGSSILPLNYQWFKRGQATAISGATSASYSFTASSSGAGDYVVRVSDSTGQIFSDFATVTVTDAPPPPPSGPSIASVSPSTLVGLPLPQTQLIRIYGSGFTGSSTLLFNGSIASDPARLYFISANEIDYYIRTDTTAANWTVKVINGAQQSNLGYFTVVASSPTTGSLTVNISPAGAISAGAQWRVDGGSYINSGDIALGLSPGSHTVSLKTVSGYNTPTNVVVSVFANQQTTVNAIYAAIANCSYSLSSYSDIFPAAGGSGAFNVVAPAGCGWTASENLSWVTITSGSSGNGTHGVFYQVDYNPSLSPRSGVITTDGGSFTINQNGNAGACTYTLSAPGANMPAEGGSNSFSVVTGSICFWSISRNAQWITLLSQQDHTGSDSVQYAVQPYFGSLPRSAAILLSADGGQTFVATFTITQAGTPPPPGTLATGLSSPRSVGMDDNYIYWSEPSVLKRVSKTGGGETALATSSVYGFGQMVLDGNYLYYLESGTKVQKLLKSGGTPTTLATGSSFYDGITVQNNTVFWGVPSGLIYSVPTTGGSVTTVATGSQDIASIRVTNNTVVWSQTTYPAVVFAQPIGGSRITLSSGVNVEPGLAIQDGFAYFTGSESMYRVPIGGGIRQTLASNLNDAYDLALDATNIYWVEAGNPLGTNGSVRQMPLSGGPIITLATNLAQPLVIAIDSTNVYWLENANGNTARSALKWAAKASAVSDVVPPSISITNPADGAQFNESLLSVNGTAADDTSVALVELRLNGGAWQTATGTTIWTGSVNLVLGTNTIEGRSRDNAGNYSSVASILVTYSPPDVKLPQTIDFGPLSKQVVGDAPFALSATASSGLPVSFSLLSGPVILSGNVVTITGAGLAVIRASQSGDATNAPAPNVDQVLLIVPGNNVIMDAQRLANGMFTMRFYGDTGTNYVVKASTNLVNWLPIATNQISGLGYLEFTDISSTNFDRRFYWITQ